MRDSRHSRPRRRRTLAMSSAVSHTSRIRALYKALLRLHRGLPLPMKALGDEYVKSEFRLHKQARPHEADLFVQEWTKYYITLARQLSQKRKVQSIGEDLSPEMMDNFQDEQLGQLHELMKEFIAANPGTSTKS